MNLQGRVALVTGGAHRLGRTIALALADAGAHIALHYHQSSDQASQTLADITAHGVEATAIAGDLSQVRATEQVVDAAVSRWGRLDVLICSAGIWGQTPLGEVTQERWDDLFALNARSPFFMAQHAAPHLRATTGCIIAITDVTILWSAKHYTPYLASKAALAMVVQNLARELAPDVRVNAVAPGPVLLPTDWDAERHAKAARSTLLGRVGHAEDVADAVVYLAQANYVTGVMIPVDGGQHLK